MSLKTQKNALIGYSGFVGSTLCRQLKFDNLYRSTNIHEIENQHFDLLICAGAPAQKWIANRDPVDDRKKINSLISHLKKITCKKFILISTVDVFKNPINVDESTPVDESSLHPYGLHRRFLEKFVQENFHNHLIVRLPGLVGPGLRKNVIFDFLNRNNIHSIDSRGIFQFYPIVNLWFDIQIAIKANLQLVHLTAEPICIAEASLHGFGHIFTQVMTHEHAHYDVQTCHASLFGSKNRYQYSRRETLQAIRTYAQSEPLCIKESIRSSS